MHKCFYLVYLLVFARGDWRDEEEAERTIQILADKLAYQQDKNTTLNYLSNSEDVNFGPNLFNPYLGSLVYRF